MMSDLIRILTIFVSLSDFHSVLAQNECKVEEAEAYYSCLKNVQDDSLKNNENVKTMKKCFQNLNCKPVPRAPFPIEKALNEQRKKTEKCANESVEILNDCTKKNSPQFPAPKNPNFAGQDHLDADLQKMPNCTDEQARNVTLCFFNSAKPQNATQLLIESCRSMKACYQKLSDGCRSLFEKSKNDSCSCYKSEKVSQRFQNCVQQALGLRVVTLSAASPSSSGGNGDDSAFCSQQDVCESSLVTGGGKTSIKSQPSLLRLSSRRKRSGLKTVHNEELDEKLKTMVAAFSGRTYID